MNVKIGQYQCICGMTVLSFDVYEMTVSTMFTKSDRIDVHVFSFIAYTAKSKILSKKKFLVSSKPLLEIRYQVNFVLPSKRFYFKQVHYVLAKKRLHGNLLLAKNNNLLKTSINLPTKKQLGI